MRDIAREVGVSIASVSHAYNNHSEISAELRDRILRVAAAHDYHPDPRARALRRNESRLIALIVSSLDNVYFSSLAHAIQETIARQGYHLVVLSTYDTKLGEKDALQTFHQERMAGAIADLHRLKQDAAYRIAGGGPVVLITDSQESPAGPAVCVDNFKAAYDAVQHLAGRGRRRIAHITGPLSAANASRRRAGYRRALRDLKLGPPMEAFGDFLAGSGRTAMTELLQRDELPDAVFASNDLMALGALTVLREEGIAVPERIAVIGFDNIEECARSVPPLTTVDQPTAHIGLTAATLLFGAIRDSEFRATAEAQCTVVVRDST
jgi:DNA-binding LacI/PurR family transcriptional regulator